MSKQERARQTYELLLDAAAGEFARHGYADVNLQQVADRTGLTKGALYWHFASKLELATALMPYLDTTLADLLSERRTDVPPMEALRTLISHTAERLDSGLRLQAALRLSQEQARVVGKAVPSLERFRDVVVELIVEARRTGTTAGRPPVQPLADLITTMLFGAFYTTPDPGCGELPARVTRMWEIVAESAAQVGNADL